MQKTVEFWFDPVCPWTWMTSRWMAEVSSLRGLHITWRPFSLRVLNEPKRAGSHGESHLRGHQIGRVVVAAQEAHGSECVGPLYTSLGERLHPENRTDVSSIITESLAEAGLSTDLAGKAAGGETVGEPADSLDDALRASTNEGIARVGPGVGIPIISIDGNAFFGPVVSPAPRGEAALQLWDGIVLAADTPGFFELKRGRDVGVQFT